MPKPKWQEPLEQIAHFTLLGVALAVLLGPLAILLVLIRELSPWKWMPWPFKGQWPPGAPFLAVSVLNRTIPATEAPVVTRMDRVEDLRRDLVATLSGTCVGIAIHIRLVFLFWQ